MEESVRDSSSPERGDNLSTIKAKTDKCKQKILQVKNRILSEQQVRKQYVDEYLNATSQSEFNENKPHFAQLKSQFEKKNARSQAMVNQLQAKLKRATDKLATLERMQRELARSQDDSSRLDTSSSHGTSTPHATSNLAVNSTAQAGSSSLLNSNPNSTIPLMRTAVVPEDTATTQSSAGKRPGSAASLKQAQTPSSLSRPPVAATASKQPPPLKQVASSTAIRQNASDTKSSDRSTEHRSFGQLNVLNTVANLFHLAHARTHALNKHHSSSTNALTNRRTEEQSGSSSSPSRKSPVAERSETKRLVSVDAGRRSNSQSDCGERTQPKLLSGIKLTLPALLPFVGMQRRHTLRESSSSPHAVDINANPTSSHGKRPGSADNIPGLPDAPEWAAKSHAQNDTAQQDNSSLQDTSAHSQSPRINTLPNSFRYGDPRLDGERASINSVNEEDHSAAVGHNSIAGIHRHARMYDDDYAMVLSQMQAVQDQLTRLQESHERFQEEMRTQAEILLDRTSRLANTCTLLEEHLNDQIDLHQSSTRGLNNEIAVVYDKLMFENRERKHEIEQIGENLNNRLGLLEAEQRRKQQIDPLTQNETTSSVLVAKLIKLAIALVSVVMLVISVITGLVNSAFRTPARVVVTLTAVTLIVAWWLRDEVIDVSNAVKRSPTDGSEVRLRPDIVDLVNRVVAWCTQLIGRIHGRSSIADEHSSSDT